MLSTGHSNAGAILIWVACAATWGLWRSPGMGCCLWHEWAHSPAAAGVWGKVHGVYYYQVLCRCSGSTQTPKTMLLLGGLDATRDILIWVP